MSEPGPLPKKDDREYEKKREAQRRRRINFAVSYLITSIFVL